MATTKITRKWQITIPAEIREGLDLEQGETLIVKRVNDTIQLEKMEGVGTRTSGVFTPYIKNLPSHDVEKLRKIAHQAVADEKVQALDEPE